MRRLTATVMLAALLSPLAVQAGELEDVIRRDLDVRTWRADDLSADAHAVMLDGGKRAGSDKPAMVREIEQAKAGGQSIIVNRFQVLSEMAAGPFTSIVYRVDSSQGASATARRTVTTVHEIWEKTEQGFKLVFSAQSQ